METLRLKISQQNRTAARCGCGRGLVNTLKLMFQDNKADVILKYNADEARSLKAYGELPEHGEFSERHGIVACCKTAYSDCKRSDVLFLLSQNQRDRHFRTWRRRRDPVRWHWWWWWGHWRCNYFKLLMLFYYCFQLLCFWWPSILLWQLNIVFKYLNESCYPVLLLMLNKIIISLIDAQCWHKYSRSTLCSLCLNCFL